MSDQAIVPAQPSKAVVAIGNRGLVPTDMDGLWRAAQAFAKSGLAPKGIDTPEAVFVAMEMGLELGLPLMASIQNIAVVNGRPTLWGDSQLAVVRATGELEEFAEWYEQAGQRLPRNPSTFDDGTAAVCRVKRRGMEASETAFTVGDAKRAGLWGKAGPWTQYPARMLRFRARSFGLRDQFGDALRGLLSTEEAQDVPVVITGTDATVGAKPRFRKPEAHALTIANTSERPTPEAPQATTEAKASGSAGGSANDGPGQSGAGSGIASALVITPAPETEISDDGKLAAIIAPVATFDEFRAWASKHFDGAENWGSYCDMPNDALAKCLAKPKAMLNSIAAMKEGVK